MSAQIIDGKSLAAALRKSIASEVKAMADHHMPVNLTALLVGDQPAARVYAENQAKSCAQLGIGYQLLELPDDTTQEQLLAAIDRLNKDEKVTGLFLHTPLPKGLDLAEAQYAINIKKDVEGVNPANIGHVVYGHTIIAPCTALAVVELIDSTGVKLQGAEVTVVGASRIVGRPLSLLLTERGATVTLCHIFTRDVAAHTRKADIVVVAVGKPGLLSADDVRQDAVVIDVGINRVKTISSDGAEVTKTVGDVQFDAVSEKAGHITPVPGGVGPMTVAMLMRNTLRAAKLLYGIEKPA